jgi:hypothetical protein
MAGQYCVITLLVKSEVMLADTIETKFCASRNASGDGAAGAAVGVVAAEPGGRSVIPGAEFCAAAGVTA